MKPLVLVLFLLVLIFQMALAIYSKHVVKCSKDFTNL